MLACARIGAPHTVVFGGFSAEALSGRINDCGAKVLITADGGWRRGKKVGLKHHADEACADAPTIEHVIVVDRFGDGVHMVPRRDHWWHEIVDRQDDVCRRSPWTASTCSTCCTRRARRPSRRASCIPSAGYLLGSAFTHWAVFDIKPDDVYWCAADIGWVTGHSYIVYGPLANATTASCTRGAPDRPPGTRWWQIVEDYKVSVLYCAPTAIRAFMKQGEEHPAARDLSSLRVLGSVGEPINPEAWRWYRDVIGGRGSPVVDTWWQTETGQIMISPCPASRPPSRARDLRDARHRGRRVDAEGRSVPLGSGGYLVLKRPWPAMPARHLRGPGALPRDVLEPLPRHVLRRRRRQARRGGLPVAPRAAWTT